MAFQQLYYTSCEDGLSGSPGYQFNAASAGVAPATMAEVERFTVYELPDSLPQDRTGDHPVNLCFTPSGAGAPIVARVVSAGPDPSGRPGNYFAHALVAAEPGAFGDTLPAQLWDAPFWRDRPVTGGHLPDLPAPLTNGPLDRDRVAAWARGRDRGWLARLLTAADRAIAGHRPVLLVGASGSVAHAVAAVSFLLAPERVRRMSFVTYSRTPSQTPAHLIGVLPETGRDLPTDGAFTVLDLTGGEGSGAADDGGERPHPLAERLVAAGTEFSETLWCETAGLAQGTEETLDDWYPVVLAALAVRLGEDRLDERDRGAVTRWLTSTGGRIPPADLDALVAVLLDGPGDTLDDSALATLHGVADRAGVTRARERVEEVLVPRGLDDLARGRTPPSPVAITSEPVRDAVAERAEALLAGMAGPADLPTAEALLEWLRDVGVAISDAAAERLGAGVLAPALLADPAAPDPVAVRITGRYVETQRGVARRLSELPDDDLFAALDGPLGRSLAEAALVRFPRVAEGRAVLAARHSDDRLSAFRRLVRARRDRQAGEERPGHAIDYALLSSVWRGEQRPEDALGVLDLLMPGVTVAPDVGAWLDDALITPPEEAEATAWRRLAGRLARHDAARLLSDQGRGVLEGHREVTAFHERVRTTDPGVWAQRLTDLYPVLDNAAPAVRAAAHLDLRDRILDTDARTLPTVLKDCPEELFGLVCARLTERVGGRRPDVPLATRFYQAATRLGHRAPDRSALLLDDRLATAFGAWDRRDLAKLRAELTPEETEAFDAWRSRTRRPPSAPPDRPPVVRSLADRAGDLLGRFTRRGEDRRE